MALTPWNRQEEWYQQMINASTGNYLPSISAQDAGKVMTVESDGSWGVENVPTELPAVETTDKDKYLHTNASTGDVEWSAAPTELPSVSGTDEGKVLTVQASVTKGAVIAAEQTVTLNSKTGTGTINNVDTSLMTDGATLLVTIDDTEYVVTFTEEPFDCGNFTISPNNETTLTIRGDGESVVVSINLASISGVWGAQNPIGKKFIVTLTPTAADYSGTMDKTVAEIDAAYEAGRKVVFRMMTGATTYMEVDCATRVDIGETYPSYSGYLIDNVNNVLIVAYTGASNDGTEATYGTYTYTLTPAT